MYARMQGGYLVITGILTFLIFIYLYRNYQKVPGNIGLRYLSYATLVLTFDWLIEGLPLLLVPQHTFIVMLGIVVYGVLFIQLCISYLYMIVLATRFPQFNLSAGYIPFLVGIFIVFLHVVSGASVSYTPEGFIAINWSPLGEFLHFFMIITGVTLYAYAFFSQIKTSSFRARIILLSTGAILVGIAAPSAYSARSSLIFHALNGTMVVGMGLSLAGILLKPKKAAISPSNP
jgi:hypothetical protein